MSTSKEKHPSWFKMKLERRTMVKQLKPRIAVNVLLACWEFLETGEKPTGLSPIESIAFSAFIPDLEDAWAQYIQRVTAISCDITRDRTRTRTRTQERV